MDAWKTPEIAFVGHIGLRCFDIAVMRAFYEDVLGFVQTDEDPTAGFVFLSALPTAEHHQVLLTGGRTVEESGGLIQQISFRCNSLEDVLAFYQRFRSNDVRIDMIVPMETRSGSTSSIRRETVAKSIGTRG
jgi:catechol 2,3-dioxygenase-like lactoylglutathione lyase family enzyme